MNIVPAKTLKLAGALALVALAACTKVAPGGAPAGESSRGEFAHVLRIGTDQDVAGLNPHLITAVSLNNLSVMTMAYLVRYDRNNRPIPELATEVPTQRNGGISRDGKTITWHLRRGVKWSDGAPFDADDMVFSTRAVLNPKNNEIGRDGWDLITKIDEPDKFTVVYHLKKPYSAYLPLFFGSAGANPCLLPKHLLGSLSEINDAPYNAKPVGIGPFRYVEWKRGDSIELEANPYYWRGTPKLKRIVFHFVPDRNTLLSQVQSGEIDLWPFVGSGYVERVKALPNDTTLVSPGFFYAHLDFNVRSPLLSDLRVRQALRSALDRNEILQKVNHGAGVVQEYIEPPVSSNYLPGAALPFDAAKANALLDAAGWKRGSDGIRAKNGRRLVFDFVSSAGTPDIDTTIEQIRGTWSQIGAGFTVRRFQQALFFGPFASGGIVYGGKWDITTFAWGLDPVGDLSNLFACDQVPPNGQNVMRYCNARADALMAQAKVVYDADARAKIVRDVQRQVDADVPTVVLYIRADIHTYAKALRNWRPNAVTPFDDMMNVDI